METLAGPFREVGLPGCKSLSARALVLAACAEGRSRLDGLSDCEDTRGLAAALAGLGAGFTDAADGGVLVEGWSGPPRAHDRLLDVGAAGSSLRFLVALLAAGETDVVVTGDARLFERPHEPLFEFLRGLGASIDLTEAGGRPGVRVQGRGLPGGEWEPPLAGSSQYLSAVLLAAHWSGALHIRMEGEIPSSGYLDLTLETLRHFRGPAAFVPEAGGLAVQPGTPSGADYAVPGDPSGATFFLVALALRGGRARLSPPWSPVHPEARLLRHLFDSGLLRADGKGVEKGADAPDRPLVFDVDGAPDAGPALAVLGAHLPQGVRLEHVGRLRLKESDRVTGIQRLLGLLGQDPRLEGDQLIVPGGGLPADPPPGADTVFDPDGDHRMAMAAGVARLAAPWLQIRTPGCVAKSFPRFWQELKPWMQP